MELDVNIYNLQYGTDIYRSNTEQVTSKQQEPDHQTSGNATDARQPEQGNGEDIYIPSPEARRLQDAMNSLEQQRTNRSTPDTFTIYDPQAIASRSLRTNDNSPESSGNTVQSNASSSQDDTPPELGRNIDYRG